MPPKEVEAIAIVFHVGSITNSNNEPNFFSMAKDCITQIIKRKIFSDSNDLLSVIVAGSENTNNDLSENGDYQNIDVLSTFSLASWDVIAAIQELQPIGKSVSWLDGVVVGIQCLRDKLECIAQLTKVKRKISAKKLVIISDFIKTINDDSQVDEVVTSIIDMGIEMIIIGSDIMKMEVKVESDSVTDFNPREDLTQSQQLILKIFNEVDNAAKENKPVYTSCSDVLEQVKYFASCTYNRSAWNVNMYIGPNLMIRITGYKLHRDDQLVKWKNVTSDGEAVHVDMSYFLGENEVDRNNIIDGYMFGSTVIPFSDNDKEAMKYCSGERGMKVLVTILKDKLPKHLLMGESTYLVGRNNDKAAQKAFNAFAFGLLKSNLIAIARKVYSNNGNVQIGALFPQAETENMCALVFVELPYKNEINKLSFPSFDDVTLTDEEIEAMDSLIDDMDLSHLDGEDDPYHPSKLLDPYEQYLYYCLAEKKVKGDDCFNKDGTIDIPDYIKSLILPMPEIVENSKLSVERIKRLFPLTEKIQEKNVLKEEKTIKVEEASTSKNDIANISDLFGNDVSEVGSLNPENDFSFLLNKGEDFEKVTNQMQHVIIELLMRCEDLGTLRKPLSCITLLRTNCIEKKQPLLYNEWIKQVKEMMVDRDWKEFWNEIIKANLGLISVEEDESSIITISIAEEFLKFVPNNNCDSQSLDEKMDIEDLLDDDNV